MAAAPAAAGIDVFGAHDMRVGEHWILDGPGPFPETPAVVCHYGADDELERMTIREPVLFKYPGAPTGAQQVGWLARVEWSDDHSVTGPWHLGHQHVDQHRQRHHDPARGTWLPRW